MDARSPRENDLPGVASRHRTARDAFKYLRYYYGTAIKGLLNFYPSARAAFSKRNGAATTARGFLSVSSALGLSHCFVLAFALSPSAGSRKAAKLRMPIERHSLIGLPRAGNDPIKSPTPIHTHMYIHTHTHTRVRAGFIRTLLLRYITRRYVSGNVS